MKSVEDQNKLNRALWDSANVLRGRMDAEDYRDYLLGLMTYEMLSSIQESYYKQRPAILRKEIKTDSINAKGFYLPKEYWFHTLVDDINGKGLTTFTLQLLNKAFYQIEESSKQNHTSFNYDGLFATCDLTNPKLGKSLQERTSCIEQLMQNLSQIDFSKYSGDVIGDAYEYLIGQFAKNTGKKAGEDYTPQRESELLTRLALLYHNNVIKSVDDPCVGSGALLLQTRHYNKANIKNVMYIGREYNATTYNLARSNLTFNKVPFNHIDLHYGDTLAPNNKLDYNPHKLNGVDAVLMNPPFSQQWGSKGDIHDDWHEAKQNNDPRFSQYGIAPKNKGDYAFLLHGLYQLNSTGVETIIVPLGVLFRGGTEGKIRKNLIQKHNIIEVIQLPKKLFFSTSIPTAMIVLKKHADNRNILFINASKGYKKDGKRNILTEKTIDKILKVSKERKTIKRFSTAVGLSKIKTRNYTLNVPMYVDTSKPEPRINISKTQEKLRDIDKAQNNINKELAQMKSQLVWTNSQSREDNKHEK